MWHFLGYLLWTLSEALLSLNEAMAERVSYKRILANISVQGAEQARAGVEQNTQDDVYDRGFQIQR